MKKSKPEENLKLVEFTVEDNDGEIIGELSIVSLVFDPAIQKSFHLFSNEKKYSFAKIDAEKQMIVGPAMTANKPILRYDQATDTYFNCFFSEETVVKCSELFLKNSNHTKTNIEHGELLTSNQISGAYCVQSWIVQDPEHDTALSYGFAPTKGDWFIAMKIDNPSLWSMIKEQGLTGFSIEGIFSEKFASILNKEIDVESKVKEILYSEDFTDLEKEIKIKNLL